MSDQISMSNQTSAADRHPDDDLVTRLTLEEKVTLVTGGSAWGTAAIPSIGLRAMVLSDGPSGVRGALWDERDPSLSLPSATALSSSWDVALAREYGAVAAAEARRKKVDVVLGPAINLHRSPLGGRHFEAFSEDPRLTADLANAYVEGMQEQGVAATPKHYVANDFETDRFNADVRVSDTALRELYLLAFERPLTDAKAWAVMSAYNSINGTTATENALLTTPLNTEWGFDGVVVSDWTAVRSIESARQPQDLAMPGPVGAWGDSLLAAVRAGDVDEASIDRKVRRLLRLAARVGALEGFDPLPITHSIDGVAFARRAEAEGSVLVRNAGILPLSAEALRRVAVIGQNADVARIQGGGSATVMPTSISSPLAGLRASLPDADVVYALGAAPAKGLAPFTREQLTHPVTGEPGALVTYLDADGAELYAEDRFGGMILDYAVHPLAARRASLTFETHYVPTADGIVRLGFAAPGTGSLHVDGQLVFEATLEDDDMIQNFFFPPSTSAPVRVRAGVPIALRYVFSPTANVDDVPGSVYVHFGVDAEVLTYDAEQQLIDQAVEVARDADVAVVVVGTTERDEAEGWDRSNLRLPGRQDDLVRAVVAANPRTVVVVNAGAPVEMPWRDDVAAVLLTWFGGQEYGNAVADVLLGIAEPGGRLPSTWPVSLADVPVTNVTPVDGVVPYDEGIHIGYKAWIKAGRTPAYPFGHGLGYTEWAVAAGAVSVAGDEVVAGVSVRNVGDRAGKQVVQIYARRPESAVERPALWLVGFAAVRADAGATVNVEVRIPTRAFAHWADEWVIEPGAYELLIGTSSAALGDPVTVALEGSELR
ncbi:beta-glucosidase [uncultured Microbacterium sp.]|uniref:beta-glucosidase family protein n=1 Tax=uncultured Microbacterium sp. TaxID=191216 RepID=UPI0035C96431